MGNYKKQIISFLMIIAIFINTFTYSNAATSVSVSVVNNPKIDVVITRGRTAVNIDNLQSDIIASLTNKGVDCSRINFIVKDTTDGVPQNSFTWIENSGIGSILTTRTKGPNYIYMKGNDSSKGQGQFITFPNTVNRVYRRTLKFDYNLSVGDSFAGGGVLLKVKQDGNYIDGYAVSLNGNDSGLNEKWLYTAAGNKTGAIFKIRFNMASNAVGSYTLVSGFSINKSGTLTIVTDDTSITVSGGGLSSPITVNTGYDSGEGFGYFAGTFKHGCSNIGAFNLTNISLLQECTLDYNSVLKQTDWDPLAKHVVINVDDVLDETLTGDTYIGEVLSRTLADDIHFIQWGTDTNKAQTSQFISRNDNKGKFTYNTNYSQAVEDTANYIKGLIEQEQETQTVVVGQPTSLVVNPSGYKTGATSTDFPNGRWKIVHNDTYFTNSMGKESDLITPNLNFAFNKSGKYTIYFDNQAVKDVYAHRLPIVDFNIAISGTSLSLTSTSYDLDTTKNIGYGAGIASEQWSYKEASATNWTTGKLTTFDNSKIYMLRLEVTDNQGGSSSTIKYIGTGNPVAKFNYVNNPVGKYKTLQITDNSYDPSGYAITGYNWTLKKGDAVVGTYTTKTPKVTFTDLEIGDYTYTLIVTNSKGTTSEPYTKGFTIIDDIDKPEISATPTSCTWKGSQIVNVTVTDPESGFGKWRYVATTSSTPPTSGWSNWITSNPSTATVTGSTTEQYYLHIEAYDAAGNLATKTVGTYSIDKTPPVTNSVAEAKSAVNRTNLTVAATDPLSGMYQYAISTTATQPSTFQSSNVLTATQLGTHYLWTKDAAGNVSYTTYNVTKLDFAVNTSSDGKGVISGYSIVPSYNATSISIIPSVGFKIKDVVIDGVSKGAISTYDFWDVTSNHTVIATFERDTPITTILNNLKNKYDWITFK